MFAYNLKIYCFIQELMIGSRKLCKKNLLFTPPRDRVKMASLPDSIQIFPLLRKSKFFVLDNCTLPLSHYKVRALR